jgi:cell wall-associated NlpC family hydrolase
LHYRGGFKLLRKSSGSKNGESSFRRISRSPLYRIYRASYITGRYTIGIFSALNGRLHKIWAGTFAGPVSKAADFFRAIPELKRSRAFRGELSLSRAIFAFFGWIASHAVFVADTIGTRGVADGIKTIGRTVAGSASGFWSRNKRVFNYIAPAAGIAVLALTVYFWSNATLGLSVTYNGKKIGTIASENTFAAAVKDIETKVTEASGASYTLTSSPVYKLELVKKSDLLSREELSDSILKASNKDVESGYGLYVDNRLVGVNKDDKAIQSMLDSITESYKNDSRNEKVSFYQDVKIKSGVFPKNIERTTSNMKNILMASSKNSQTYIAQKGDSAEMVANMYHITVDQLYAMNSNVTTGSLTQGQMIRVVDSMPTLSVKYTRRETSTQAIPYAVVSSEAANIAKGRIQVTQAGANGTMQVVSDVSYVGNTVVESKTVSTTMLKAPVNQTQLVGTFDYTAKASNLIGYAGNFVGSAYSSGAAGPYAFDCSGYTMFVFEKFGISLPHNAAAQASYGSAVSRSNLQAGDLVFFNTSGYGIGHVGIYVGNGEFVNAENYGAGVTYCSLSGYWSSTYVCARRLW